MAYKKYIQKNGKLYGPYIYHSKRVDGKVVSEYRGQKSNFDYKTFLFVSAGIVLLTALVFFFIFSTKGMTGNVVLSLDSSYEAGKPLDGVLKFSIKEGEFIPSSSKIILENSGKTYEFPLNEVISQSSSNGEYYIYNKNLQGSGEGYGIEGERTIYPEIEFILQVYNEITDERVDEVIDEQSSVEEELTEPIIEENIEPLEETPQEITSSGEEFSASITGNAIKSSRKGLFSMTGMVTLELENEITGKLSKEKEFVYELKEGQTAELKPKSVKLGDKELEDNTISLTIENGKAIVRTDYSEIEKGYGEEYIGNKEETFSLNLQDLNLILEEGNLTVKLVYGEEELVQLTTYLEEGEKVSNETVIEEEIIEENKSIEIPVLINETPKIPEIPILTNQTNETIELPVVIPQENLTNLDKNFTEESEGIEEFVNSSIWRIADFLSTEDRKIILNKFGDMPLISSSTEFVNGKITRKYYFDNYYFENSYNPSLTRELLEVEMEKDRVKFLKEIVSSVSE